MITELRAPFHVTAGYVGVPGDRTFYLQFEDEHARISLLCEKAQVAGLGQLVARLLARIDDEPATDWDRRAMDLREPVEPRWRIGELSVGVDTDAGRFVLEIVEFVPEDSDEEPEVLRVWTDHDQARRFAAHAEEVVGEGRPTCRFCELPIDPDGHVCPAMN